MNEAKEFLKKKGLSESNNFGGYGGDNVAKLLSEYAQQVSIEFAFEMLGHNEHPNSNIDGQIKNKLKASFNEWIKTPKQ